MNDANHVSDLTQFIGRFHPLLVHLPLGFLVLLGSFEALALHPRCKHLASVSRPILALTLPVACFSAFTGWLLAGADGYDAGLLVWHRWFGVSVACAVPLLLLLQRASPRAYRVALGLTLVLVMLTGHIGGSLTHGRDYLTRYWPFRSHSADPEPDGPATQDRLTQPVFAAVIQPILKKNCVSCHGPEKSKAKLRLDSYENLQNGGEDGPVVEPGASLRSLLIKRLRLPAGEDDHMPPDGKPQPSANDIALLAWWIDAGAPDSRTAQELNPPPALLRLLSGQAK
jgi:uncharacterized membrane protein/mono/diheme cytochrome c family protein